MGYEDDDYWRDRFIRVKALQRLRSKYNFTNIDIIAALSKDKIKSNMLDDVDCAELFTNCKDAVTASYAVDQISCVAIGALGWTGVGAVLFIGCEAAANYKMYIGDKNCNTNYKNCK